MPELQQNLGTCNARSMDAVIRSLLADIIRRSPKKRQQIAEEMGLLLGVRITSFMLDCFTSVGKASHRFPAAWIEAFCLVTNDNRLQRLVMGSHFGKLVDYAERDLKAAREERDRKSLREELLRD